MENKCKIVQDLLPTYIEKMTSEETTEFVKEHLENCSECREIYNKMNTEIEEEYIEDTEKIKIVKQYRRRIFTIKLAIILAIIIVVASSLGSVIFKFWILRNAYEKNTNYTEHGNFTVFEYDDAIETHEKYYTAYHRGNEIKKFYGDDVIEYYDGTDYYYFDNENMTYRVEKNAEVNLGVDVNISLIAGMENIVKDGKISNFEILKFIICNPKIKIGYDGFRSKGYYGIADSHGNHIYLDMDTFFAERVSEDVEDSNINYTKEYRITVESVNWRQVAKPDLSRYTLVEE